MKRFMMTLIALLAFTTAAQSHPPEEAKHDYPTDVRADYVFACMAVSGDTLDALRRCSCSIDTIAKHLPYEEYVQAETVLRMRQASGGERTAIFRATPWAQRIVDKLRRAQVEAELACSPETNR